MQKSNYKLFVIAVIAAAIVGIALWYFLIFKAPIALSDAINNQLEGDTGYSVSSIEEMAADESPAFAATDTNGQSFDQVAQAIATTKIVYEKDEVGAVFENKSYTITINSSTSDDCMSFTLTDKTTLHINDSEKTYTLQDSTLYVLCSGLNFS